ncbi:hypothetical protein BC835DRAFT_671856 [Cytidiella melzeri]|nr:hypothetical protein BC835DRAFT_671856 [Cytidiella melzeri]
MSSICATPIQRSSSHSTEEYVDMLATPTQNCSTDLSGWRTNPPPPLPRLPPGLFTSQSSLQGRISSSQSETFGSASGASRSRIQGPRPIPLISPESLQPSRSLSSLAPTQQSQPPVGTPSGATKNQDLEESPKFRSRRARIREMERLQELEDERDIDKQNGLHVLQTLLASHPFSSVTATFEDLDGLGDLWDQGSMRRVMKERWDRSRMRKPQPRYDYLVQQPIHYEVNGLSSRKHHRSVHALYDDLAADGRELYTQSAPLTRSKSEIAASISMPLASFCPSLSRTASTIKPRMSALSRQTSLSAERRDGAVQVQPSVAVQTMNRSRSGFEKLLGSRLGVPVDRQGMSVKSHALSSDAFLPPQDPVINSMPSDGRWKDGKNTLPRMTRTVSSAKSDSIGYSVNRMSDHALVVHAENLAQVEALRARDLDDYGSAEIEAPLMIRARSSAGTSGSSSFGIRPLRVKKINGRSRIRSIAELGPWKAQMLTGSGDLAEDIIGEEQEEINIQELEHMLKQADRSLLWGDELNGDEQEIRTLQPPPMAQARGMTWSGGRPSYISGSTISRASGRGKHSTRRPPNPFVAAMGTHSSDLSRRAPSEEVSKADDDAQ